MIKRRSLLTSISPLLLLSVSYIQAATQPDIPLNTVLSQLVNCSDTITIRSQSLTKKQQKDACKALSKQEKYFHQVFNTQGKPVKHDNNTSLRVNVYSSATDYKQHAGNHFNISTDNGGMYLEGYPEKPGNHAEFISYEKDEKIWNLRHEYVHYLDARFNLYGDFCASLHDNHSAPENCASPSPLYPHTVWWSEGLGEYIAWQNDHPRALTRIADKPAEYKLSEIFNTSYEKNGGGVRVYYWGYSAVRFMMEKQRDKVEEMLVFLRAGDFPRYQALVTSWGTSMDAEFAKWLAPLLKEKANVAKK